MFRGGVVWCGVCDRTVPIPTPTVYLSLYTLHYTTLHTFYATLYKYTQAVHLYICTLYYYTLTYAQNPKAERRKGKKFPRSYIVLMLAEGKEKRKERKREREGKGWEGNYNYQPAIQPASQPVINIY